MNRFDAAQRGGRVRGGWSGGGWRFTAAIVLGFAFGACPSSCLAVLILIRGVDRPVGGYLLRDDANVVVIRERDERGHWRERSFRKSELNDILQTVSTDRLQRLRPSRPEDYRDYAEELAEKRLDPEARDMAIRLFLIAAHLAPDKFEQSALLALVDLARNPREAARFRALSYLCDARHDPQRLQPRGQEPNPQSTRVPADKPTQLAVALRQLRRGERDAARQGVERAVARGEFVALEATMTAADLLTICQENPLSSSSLRKVLLAELALRNSWQSPMIPSPGPAEARTERWSQSLGHGDDRPITELTIGRITEYDPRQCEYREGKWTARRSDP